jgi:hypothetical protein
LNKPADRIFHEIEMMFALLLLFQSINERIGFSTSGGAVGVVRWSGVGEVGGALFLLSHKVNPNSTRPNMSSLLSQPNVFLFLALNSPLL